MTKKNFKTIAESATSKFLSIPLEEQDTKSLTSSRSISKSMQTDIVYESDKTHDHNKKKMVTPYKKIKLQGEILDYINVMSRLEGISATKYIHRLIEEDKKIRNTEFSQFSIMVKRNK